MARPASTQPTPGELQILRVLWKKGPSTCREVHDVLVRRNNIGYTTILKLLQIMVTKGLAARDEEQRSHVYRAKVSQTGTQRRMVKDMIDRVFEGSSAKLVMQALSAKRASREDLDEIRQMIDKAKGGKR